MNNEQNTAGGFGDAPSTTGQPLSPRPKTVEVDADRLEKMMERLETLEKQQVTNNSVIAGIKQGEWIANAEQVHTATLKKYRKNADEDYKLIVGWEKFEEDEEHNKLTLTVALRDKNGKISTEKMTLQELVALQEPEVVKVVKRDVKKLRMVTGWTTIKNVEFDKFRTIDTGQRIPLEENREVGIATVETSDGTQFEIPEQFLNGAPHPIQ